MALNYKQKQFLRDRVPVTLLLNQRYLVSHAFYKKVKPTVLKLIKVTPKGFNLLNEETGICVMKPHLYPWKKSLKTYDDPMEFWITNSWQFVKIDTTTIDKINEHLISIKMQPIQLDV